MLNIIYTFLILSLFSFSLYAEEDLKVGITRTLKTVEIMHNGEKVTIKRNQDTDNVIDFDFSFTSRPCPPFCVQPIKLAEGVETIGELELLDYLEQSQTDDSILVIDSRTADWAKRGMIPGAINISWENLFPPRSDTETIKTILTKRFGAKVAAEREIELDVFTTVTEYDYDFSEAKTLVLYCNGMWCGQSPTNIKTLLVFGYPAEKLKWYRGGMQAWKVLGFTTVTP